MNGIDEIFVINLERRKDRLMEFIDRIRNHTTLSLKDITLFKAIDGKKLHPTKDIKYLCRNCDYSYQPGIIGCCLSHYDIWRNISGSNYIDKALILEDDAMIFDGIDPVKVWNEDISPNYPEDCDLLWLGKSEYEDREKSHAMFTEDGIFSKKFKSINPCMIPMGTTAYVITKKLAQKYVELINNFGLYRAIDGILIDIFKTDIFKTDIFKTDIFKTDINPFSLKTLADFKNNCKKFDIKEGLNTFSIPDLEMSAYRLIKPIIDSDFYYKTDIQNSEMYSLSVLNNKINLPIIKICWFGFWVGFSNDFNFFKLFIENHFNVQVISKVINNNQEDIEFLKESDIIFCSLWVDVNPIREVFNSKKYIVFSGEQVQVHNKKFDLSIGFDHIESNNNYMRLPLWFLYIDWFNVRLPILMKNPDSTPFFWLTRKRKAKPRKKFCLFVCGDGKCEHRNKIFERLHAIKHIDSAGRMYNNMKIPGDNYDIFGKYMIKTKFSQDYRFALCPENESHPGYCTEKILNAFAGGCVPIYWGDMTVTQDFNEKAFVNGNGKSIDEVISEVMEIENNPEKWIEIASQPVFRNPDICRLYEMNLKKYLRPIIDSIV